MSIVNSTERFSGRVEDYIKYRPGYPEEVLDFLGAECGLSAGSAVADVGSGTGIFTSMLLRRGYTVYAVEPNLNMQHAARLWLDTEQNFIPVDATAEATTLETHSLDMVVCAQAFHWFNNERARMEFNRILKPAGFAALVWNNRLPDADQFSYAYENLLKSESLDYNKVNHRNIGSADLKAFFRNGKYKQVNFRNRQVFDFGGVCGRAFSSSYVPPLSSAAGIRFREKLQDIFVKHNVNGKVSFYYKTEVYTGKV
ncbi:MAG TPA: class I SAM-dependent methyltransferase [Mucilaginibacter sp.]|nr:class I SAM-dependent methyltransferase [Mucilaginibacter sp.]